MSWPSKVAQSRHASTFCECLLCWGDFEALGVSKSGMRPNAGEEVPK